MGLRKCGPITCSECGATATVKLGPHGEFGLCEACKALVGPIPETPTAHWTRREIIAVGGSLASIVSAAITVKRALRESPPAPRLVQGRASVVVGTSSLHATGTVVPLEVVVSDNIRVSDQVQLSLG